MRNGRLFSGTSHPVLAQRIANHLNISLSPVTVQRFPNQEITVSFGISVRDQNVYIIQSGSNIVNDHVMELVIMIRAAKMSSARKVTVIIPYYPYSKQSKKKKHRGAITAKLVADMLTVSGADHIITLDLHAYQISGFFPVPLDNLFSKPTIANWIENNIPDYKNAVVVAKNTGGAKRVTGLADTLGINFALIYVDNSHAKTSFSRAPSSVALQCLPPTSELEFRLNSQSLVSQHANIDVEEDEDNKSDGSEIRELELEMSELDLRPIDEIMNESDDDLDEDLVSESNASHNSPLLSHTQFKEVSKVSSNGEPAANGANSAVGAKKLSSNPKKIVLIGDVRDKLVLLVDDLIDRPRSFLTVAEHLTENCGAKGVYIFTSHGLFNDISLEEIENCPFVQKVITTNSYPISNNLKETSTKLVQIDISPLLAEAIRRNHNGESISSLFERPI
ncbi:Ribose-phosphate pyrophosphokinase 1 [Smittium culicis]|uniref:ribose-phosphate diphosphokinase n=1 Tax=Smittium culicis TaxID=133412 RepID=A0A1R1XU29_9FUNG|nr:Ribose-phosphate pyrophosphokinase 1 [Smittium culicis]